jgi:hypothetical protein
VAPKLPPSLHETENENESTDELWPLCPGHVMYSTFPRQSCKSVMTAITIKHNFRGTIRRSKELKALILPKRTIEGRMYECPLPKRKIHFGALPLGDALEDAVEHTHEVLSLNTLKLKDIGTSTPPTYRVIQINKEGHRLRVDGRCSIKCGRASAI